MILENTPYPTVLKVMQEEKEKVYYFLHKLSAKVDSPNYKGNKDVISEIYTHPKSKNTYLIWGGWITTPVVFSKLGNHNFRLGECLMVNTSNGERMVYSLGDKNDGGKMVKCLMVYTSHFLRRYRERAGWGEKMSTIDLISTFMNRNMEMIPLDYSEFVKKPVPNGVAIQMCDGVILGSEEKYNIDGYEFNVVKHNTFIPKSLMKSDQEDALMTKEKMRGIIAEWMKDIVSKHPILSQFI